MNSGCECGRMERWPWRSFGSVTIVSHQHEKPGKNEGEKMGITMEITESFRLEKTSRVIESNHESIIGNTRIAARELNPTVPPWEDSLGLGMLEIIGTTWKDRGAGTKEQESTCNTPLWNPWNCCERGCLSLLLLQARPWDDDPSLHQTLLQDFPLVENHPKSMHSTPEPR